MDIIDDDDDGSNDDHEVVEPYTVGYACPPVEHRFKPNVSGNPRGRPPGSKGFDKILAAVMSEKREFKDSGKVLRQSNLHVLIMRIKNAAVMRNRKALILWEKLQGMLDVDEAPVAKGILITSEEMDAAEWDSRYVHLSHSLDGSDCDESCAKSKHIHRNTWREQYMRDQNHQLNQEEDLPMACAPTADA